MRVGGSASRLRSSSDSAGAIQYLVCGAPAPNIAIAAALMWLAWFEVGIRSCNLNWPRLDQIAQRGRAGRESRSASRAMQELEAWTLTSKHTTGVEIDEPPDREADTRGDRAGPPRDRTKKCEAGAKKKGRSLGKYKSGDRKSTTAVLRNDCLQAELS